MTLFTKLTDAGLPIIDATEDGRISSNSMTAEQEAVFNDIVYEHMNGTPAFDALVRIRDRKSSSKTNAKAIPNWATWDEAQTVQYITDNVTSLATAKTVLIAMARLIVALRDETWPDLPEGN